MPAVDPPREVFLRPVLPGDLPDLFEHQREPEGARMAAFVPRERDAFDAHWRKLLENPKLTTRAIVADGVLAGNIGAWDGEGERLVGYWIAQAHWGRGIASRALAAFLAVERVRPLMARVVKTNAASLRVLLRCGFVIVGEEGGHDSGGVTEVVLRCADAPPA